MPLTKAIITVSSEITMTKASAVISVVRQRTVRLRTRYRNGIFTPNSSASQRERTDSGASDPDADRRAELDRKQGR